jgi:hypothetical protein
VINGVFEMPNSCEEGDSKAGFYYDLKFVIALLYVIFVAASLVLLGLSAFADFPILVFLCILLYLDLQEFIEVRVPRYGWKCPKNNYKIASALLMISLFLIPVGEYLLDSKIAVRSPLFFFLLLGLMFVPALLGMIFALTCYMDFGHSLGFWKKDEEIIKAFIKHSYFYRYLHYFHRKIFGRKSTEKQDAK